MTDKEKIRTEVERRIKSLESNIGYGIGVDFQINAYESLLSFIDTLEVKEVEEPASKVWHNSNEEQPNYASTVAIWYPEHKNGEIISRCVEVYSDRIWAYIEDLLKM